MNHVTFIGAGNMASSLVGGLVKSGHPAEQITVSDINPQQLAALADNFGIRTEPDNLAAVQQANAVVIAVKPNIVRQVCHDIAAGLSADTVVLSIAAGVREADISRWIGVNHPVVRSMPNTPALLGAGISALFANQHCSPAHTALAESVLQAAGTCVQVTRESDLDSVTGVSGSGPAYFFHLIECMTDSGVDMGLDRDTAEQLAIETAYGAALMARQRKTSPAQLRENVTSPNGTTAAALNSFKDDGFAQIIDRGIKAARDRADELGEEFGKDPDSST